MSMKFIAGILSMSLFLGCSVYITSTAEAESREISCSSFYEEEILEESFEVEPMNDFKDPEIKDLSLEQIKNRIKEQEEIQASAHNLANHARNLGWPEDCETIKNAQIEWENAEKAIVFYQTAYNKKYEELGIAKWDARREEYPEATEIWLYMKNLGWNDYVCAGIMGNIMAEVGGQTLNLNPYSESKEYYGMCQWSKKYSNIQGGNLIQQCDYLRDTIKYEFDTFGYAYRKGFNYDSFLALKNSKQAALAFAKCYERCGSGTYTVRQDNAYKAYKYFVS